MTIFTKKLKSNERLFSESRLFNEFSELEVKYSEILLKMSSKNIIYNNISSKFIIARSMLIFVKKLKPKQRHLGEVELFSEFSELKMKYSQILRCREKISSPITSHRNLLW